MFNDNCNVYFCIKSGSGGEDSHNCVYLLYKMYISWLNVNNYRFKILNINRNVNNIKSVSLKIYGKYIYGLLKFESGIHRLIRKSPYSGKRHTSFISINVYPEINNNNDIFFLKKDLKIYVFKSSGCGGQHVNNTNSAVRIVHIPTNISVSCQSERSQYRNKYYAIKYLKSKLVSFVKHNDKKKRINELISWGNQVRTYVIDKSFVKDSRTNIKLYNIKMVLDGYLDPFIYFL